MSLNQETIKIKGSPAKLLGYIVLGIIMTGVSALSAFAILPNAQNSFIQFVGWVGVVFFGGCLLIFLSRLISSGKVVLMLTPEGLWDTRVAEKPIPWGAMEDISVWASYGQKIIVIAVPPEVEESLGLTRLVHMSRAANAKLGADGLCIASTGLKISHEELLSEIIARAEATRVSA